MCPVRYRFWSATVSTQHSIWSGYAVNLVTVLWIIPPIYFHVKWNPLKACLSIEKPLSRPLHDVPSVTDFFLLWINDCWTPEPTPLSLRSLWSSILSLFYPIHGDINALEYSSAWSFSQNNVPSVTENFKWPTCSFIESKLKIEKINMKVWYCNLEMVKYSDH